MDIYRSIYCETGRADAPAKPPADEPCRSGEPACAPYPHRRACSDRRQRQLRSAAEAKLLVDMMQAHLHGAFGQMELAGDFLVAQTSRYKVGDFSVA